MSRIIICVAVYDTDTNERSDYTQQTIDSLNYTINKDSTIVVFVDNNSCRKTKTMLNNIKSKKSFYVITNTENVGTAEAINQAIYTYANPEDYVVKLDNDVTFSRYGWADEMRDMIEHHPVIGVLGLKRVDLPNQPNSIQYPTMLKYIPHELGQKWRVFEVCDDVIGTCHMYNPLLREKVGYLWQPGTYGYDDVLMCARSSVVGFTNGFYPCVDIVHLDKGDTPYTDWKRRIAGKYLNQIRAIIDSYQNGTRPIYYNPFEP